jgi:NitT/TauT family transport system substrate-binding protein
MQIYSENGVYVDQVYVAGGSRVSQTVIAGEFAVALAGGNIVFADLAGGDIVTFGGVVNVPSFYLYVQPMIKTQEDLRGKTLGITRYGASTDFTLRYLLKKWGLEPDRDVKVIQMGGQPEILAGMQAGVIHGGVLSSPGDFKARAVSMFANARLGLDYPTTSLVSTRSTIKGRETVRRFLMAIARPWIVVSRQFSHENNRQVDAYSGS